jgi:hypothetical protein
LAAATALWLGTRGISIVVKPLKQHDESRCPMTCCNDGRCPYTLTASIRMMRRAFLRLTGKITTNFLRSETLVMVWGGRLNEPKPHRLRALGTGPESKRRRSVTLRRCGHRRSLEIRLKNAKPRLPCRRYLTTTRSAGNGRKPKGVSEIKHHSPPRVSNGIDCKLK